MQITDSWNTQNGDLRLRTKRRVNKGIVEIINENFYRDCFYFVDSMYIPTLKRLNSLVTSALLLDINVNDEIRTVIIIKDTITDAEKKALRREYPHWWYVMMDSTRYNAIKSRYLPGGGSMRGPIHRWLAFDAKNGCNGKIMSVNIPDEPALRDEFNKKYQLTHTICSAQSIRLAGIHTDCTYHVIDDMMKIPPIEESGGESSEQYVVPSLSK